MKDTKVLFEELTSRIEGDVSLTQEDLESHATDWSLFSIMPKAIVYPKHSKDVQEIVRWVNEKNSKIRKISDKLSLTVRAAGTDMSGGPLNNSIIVDVTRYMSGVISVEETREYPDQKSFYGHTYAIAGKARVLPGTYYRDFEIETFKKNLILPCYPASKNLCALGGMVANNGAGEKSLKYGQNKDFVKSLKVVLSDGNEYTIRPLTKKELDKKIVEDSHDGKLYKNMWNLVRGNYDLISKKRPKTSKNSAGYLLWDIIQASSLDSFVQGEGTFDLTKMFVGAQGTTGIITEIEYALVEREKNSDLLVVYVDDLGVVPELVDILMKSDLEMLEMYDDQTFKIGMRFFRDFIKDKGIIGSLKYALRFLPEVALTLRGGVPKLVILAEFVSNNEQGLHKEMQQAVDHLSHLGLRMRQIKSDAGEERFWDFRHDSFKLLTEHTRSARVAGEGTRTAPFIDDIAVNPEHLPEYLPKLIKILKKYNLDYTIAGHLGNGNFHIIPLMDMNKEENRDKIIAVSDEVYELALSLNGSITAEHNDGIIRTPYLPMMFGQSMMTVFNKAKKFFDPKNIFNPGKKIGLTKEDITKYMA